MKKLVIGMHSGILNQLQDTNETICGRDNYLSNNYVDFNSWFWSSQLNNNKIEICLNKMISQAADVPIKLQWAMRNPRIFMEKFVYAKNNTGNSTIGPRALYSQLEILQMACEILYYTETAPFHLDICSGFSRSADSSKELRENCLKKYANPYLIFIQDNIMPLIEREKPEILWFYGKPNIISFTIARLARELNADIYIGISNHSSEYYSLNKLLPTLMYNKELYKVFDIIILHDDLYTMKLVEKALGENQGLGSLSNIVFTPDRGKTIIRTKISKPHLTLESQKLSGGRPISIRLFPEKHCYWNKCSFCGINNKYLTNTKDWNYNYAFKLLSTLHKQRQNKLWLIDEALPNNVLQKLADKMLSEQWEFEWHVRTRIESDLLNQNMIHKLRAAGLKNILLGFESASERILSLMNKTEDCSSYLEIAEKIVKQFNNVGISVHFPAIIGFPTESKSECNRTVQFLEYLRTNYPLFSYNINILELDISSDLYKNHAKYNISTLHYPCPPYSFLGNSVKWGTCDADNIEKMQNDAMRHLFPWFPEDSFLDIVPFYKLVEHTRNPFWYKELYAKETNAALISKLDFVIISDNISCFKDNKDKIVLFNEDTFNYIQGGDLLQDIYSLKNWTLCKNLIKKFPKEFHGVVLDLLQKLVDYKILNVRR